MEKLSNFGLQKENSKKVAEKLNELLANYHVYYQNLREFHWNIKGIHFFNVTGNVAATAACSIARAKAASLSNATGVFLLLNLLLKELLLTDFKPPLYILPL